MALARLENVILIKMESHHSLRRREGSEPRGVYSDALPMPPEPPEVFLLCCAPYGAVYSVCLSPVHRAQNDYL